MLKSTGFSAVLHFSAKLLISTLICSVFLVLLSYLFKLHADLLASQHQLQNQSLYVGNKLPTPGNGSSAVHPLWPEFPHGRRGRLQTAVINGVPVVTEDWETSASPFEILSYYRNQMGARGWRDVTEKAYGLDPSLHQADFNDERFVIVYRKIMESSLVMTRGDWSLHLTTEPGTNVINKTVVKIYSAATPLIMNFFLAMESGLSKKESESGHPLDVVQRNGDEIYHTRIGSVESSPAEALKKQLSELAARGWQPVVFLPKAATPDGYFSWLIRGKQYAALSIKSLGRSGGSSITFTEVTPKQ